MSRYRKSIRQTLAEVGEWQPATEPEVLVEEAPIPTETGRKLLKNRIAHQKIDKKEIKYYPMGDVFKGKLQKTTEYLKEALELDGELGEAVKWEVKVSGLPVFYSDGKSKGAVRQMLRKLLKHPDDIQSITRTTSAELKKIRRGQIAGDEPGEDEDKNPVGPDYNEEVELDELSPELATRAYKGARKKRQQIFNKSDETDRIPNVKKQDRQAKKFASYAAKEEVEGWDPSSKTKGKLPKHLSKFLDKKGNPNKEAQARIDAGRKKRAAAAAKPKITDVTPKGYGPNEEDEMAIMSLDHKEPPRKLKLTQQGLEAFKQSRDEGFGLPPSTVADKNLGAKINTAHAKEQKRRAKIDAKRIAAGKKLPYKKEGFEGPFSAPGSGSIAKPRKAKAGDENKSIEQQMADARKESLAFQENEWDTMWKNAAKEKPKMSFKQAIEFVDEVGLDKKEKKDALKNAKKWLK